ncbi:hypothetical protein PsorP6_000276 [Peronosclerospora sorghi]|uniref:Uncharacterized protein n=1 Tax=Peronosclerospora sorghi TaxID=230839 RepID=A0ACC0WPC6_9STRA|nr:hypothetical protein PsorP6_000276 [Peronosclerospora sorghi]
MTNGRRPLLRCIGSVGLDTGLRVVFDHRVQGSKTRMEMLRSKQLISIQQRPDDMLARQSKCVLH